MMISLGSYIIVSMIMFTIGLLGVLLRRNVIVIYICLELMLNASMLALVAFSRYNNNIDGSMFVFFVMMVAAAEVGVGLALVVALYKKRQTVLVNELTSLNN
jgi:NADH-quinone oxidoreductase subunit K